MDFPSLYKLQVIIFVSSLGFLVSFLTLVWDLSEAEDNEAFDVILSSFSGIFILFSSTYFEIVSIKILPYFSNLDTPTPVIFSIFSTFIGKYVDISFKETSVKTINGGILFNWAISILSSFKIPNKTLS